MHAFQRAPTLGGECYNGELAQQLQDAMFQRAPTLGGECYKAAEDLLKSLVAEFQRAPTLGGECYRNGGECTRSDRASFNGHPPLGVNATVKSSIASIVVRSEFQRAPTLGGECYLLLLYLLAIMIILS